MIEISQLIDIIEKLLGMVTGTVIVYICTSEEVKDLLNYYNILKEKVP